ncbi:VQ motif-containing protein 9 [Cardamine amara subsp. amara]|uniref:VQ motif-containing protein 9 n=1 Tax=Cardamine amara subsp. amara TaxID=228776 RepID=A0ABD1C359_CARAN
MDKSCNSSGDSSAVSVSASTTSSTGNNTGNRDHYLRQLNKLSHKITKPTVTSSSSSAAVNREIDRLPPPPPINQGNLHQHQPPVYNINKNDFRDVVQKLTGSPAHERISAPPQQPIHHPKPQQSSRLHRIRPPPLAHVINRPPTLLNGALIPQGSHQMNPNQNWTGGFIPRPTAPLSPLPPLPPVHAAAESPVSSYMRYLQNSMFAIDSNRKEFSGLSPLAPLVSPRWYQQQQQENAPPSQNSLPPHPPPPTAAVPTSIPAPPPFGCLNSPKSPYGLLSPSILLSPTSGQLGFPVSPTTTR